MAVVSKESLKRKMLKRIKEAEEYSFMSYPYICSICRKKIIEADIHNNNFEYVKNKLRRKLGTFKLYRNRRTEKMDDEEIIKYLLENPETRANLQISSILNILAKTMISHGWFTEDEFNKAVDKSLEQMAQDTVNRMSKEQRSMVESSIQISKDPLFGNLLK